MGRGWKGETKRYIYTIVVPDSPAEVAGIKAGTQTIRISGRTLTIGGDVIIGVDGVNGAETYRYDGIYRTNQETRGHRNLQDNPQRRTRKCGSDPRRKATAVVPAF